MLDRFPKKPCKFCGELKHFSYACRLKPQKTLQRSTMPIQRSQKPLKRSRLNPIGKNAKLWIETRHEWIKKNPPPIRGEFWTCYLQIHEWCPKLINLEALTIDHVVSRTRDPSLRYSQANLRPACIHCNEKKGSRSLDEVKPGIE